ncbi:MAG TPA: redoxin domain-containing protein [Verrucomicrobiota bacterium]|nr:redoxin domain-containing protein [Verrucomicrobiota bacterium]
MSIYQKRILGVIVWIQAIVAVCQNSATTNSLPEIGVVAPQIQATNFYSNEIKKPKIEKGKNYLLIFVAEKDPRLVNLPNHILDLAKKYQGAGIDFTVIFERSSSTISNIADKFSKTLNLCIDNDGVSFKNYGLTGSNKSYSFLIDSNSKIVWMGDAFSYLENVISALLENKIDADKLRRSFILKKIADEYFTLALEGTKKDEMAKLGEKILKDAGDDPLFLNEFAWNIMTDEKIRYHDMVLALRASRKACDLVKGTQPPLLDTYARALFLNGQIKDAVQIQQMAIELATDEMLKKKLIESLNMYKKALKEVKPSN